MKRNLTLFLIVPTLLVFAGLAFAGHHYGGGDCMRGNWDMEALDTNPADGGLTFDEYISPQMKKWRSGFDMIDQDKDGVISTSEWDAFLKVHGKS